MAFSAKKTFYPAPKSGKKSKNPKALNMVMAQKAMKKKMLANRGQKTTGKMKPNIC